MAWAQRTTQDEDWCELSLVFTDDAGITDVNRQHLGRDDATDVISFRYDPVVPSELALRGEVIVNVQRACEVGPGMGGCDRELAQYLAHGCDHLMNETDDTKAGYQRMRRRELRWLKKAGAQGLLDELLAPSA